MKTKILLSGILAATALNVSANVNSGVNDSQIVTFTAGNAAKAAEVNQTIAELKRAINANAALISDLQSKVEVDNSVAGRCYDYQATYQKLRNFENSSGQVSQANVEIGDVDAILRFDSANMTAHLTGQENLAAMIVGPAGNNKNGTFIEFSDYESYEKPVGHTAVDREIQWAQSGDTVTVTYSLPDTTFDLVASEDGSTLTGTFRRHEAEQEPGATHTTYKYELQNVILREVDCSQ